MPDESLPQDRHTIPEPTIDHAPAGDTRPGSSTVDPQKPAITLAQSPGEMAHAAAISARDLGWPVIPGYEILGVLGRGAMGVVYEARQVGLKRLVALKMILGARAGRNELIRFLAEAEAVATVKHANVVQVFDYGDSEAGPYMALEHLRGGTLAKFLHSERRDPVALASLVADVARGVAAAHSLGIVHRDLKPANIMFDEAGIPKVTDFGLAKRGIGSDLTAPLAIMGTPLYMSPEQADGRTKFVGPQADVWALGVILYEAVTGTRPFEHSDRDLLYARIRSVDPVPPRKLAPSISRDLELICMKCLEKLPHDRYPTAKELADDLDRLARHEPISVRPAGPIERATKWVRRNTIVAGAAAAVFLALAVGAGVSVAFALEAREQATAKGEEADRANNEWARANRERDDAIDKGLKLVAANKDLRQSRDWLAQSTARSILRPLGLQDPRSDQVVIALTGPEIDALWDLASGPDTELRRRFVAEAVRDPVRTRQLKNSATYSLHAAVGLTDGQREATENLLADRAGEGDLTAAQRISLLQALSRLDGLSPRASIDSARALLAVADKKSAETFVPALCRFLRHAEPADAVDLASGVIADPAIRLYSVTTREVLTAATARMGPVEAKKVYKSAAGHILKRLTLETDANDMNSMCWELVSVSALLDPEQTSEVCSLGASILGFKIANTSYPFTLQIFARALAGLAEHVERSASDRVRSQVAATLARALANTVDPQLMESLSGDLARAAKYLSRDEAIKVCGDSGRRLAAAIRRTAGDGPAKVVTGIAALAPHMAPSDAAACCDQVVAVLVSTLGKTTDVFVVPSSTGSLSRIAPYLSSEVAATSAANLADIMKTRTDHGTLQWLSDAFVALVTRAGRSDPDLRRKAASHLTEVMEKATDSIARGSLATSLAEVMTGMNPADATVVSKQAIATLSQAIARATDPSTLRWAAQGLGRLASRIDRLAAAEVCRPAVAKLLQVLSQLDTAQKAGEIGIGLETLTANLDPREVADLLLPAITRAGTSSSLSPLSLCLLATTARMEPKAAVETLIRAMRNTASAYRVTAFTQNLTSLARRLTPSEVTEVVAILRRAAPTITDPDQLKGLATALTVLSRRLPRGEAAEACRPAVSALERALGKAKSPYQLKPLCLAIAAVAEHLPAAEAEAACRKAAEVLLPILNTTTDVSAIDSLSEALGQLAKRMGAKEARESVLVMTKVLGRITNGFALRSLVDGLSAVAHRCDPTKATVLSVQAASILIEIAAKYPDPRDAESLGACLQTILSGPSPMENSKRTAVAAAAVGSSVANNAFVTLPLISRPEPLPCRLSTQQLVDLLKHPCCRNECNRVVLRILEEHYRRNFADSFNFVRFAKDQGLGLDFTTPPKRPEIQR